MYEAQYRVLETKNGCGFIWRISRNLEGAKGITREGAVNAIRLYC